MNKETNQKQPEDSWKRVNERKETKKKTHFLFWKKFNFRTSKLKIMAWKLFEFQEQFMIHTYFVKLTQFEKTGSIGQVFIPLRNLKIEIQFRN